LANLSSTAPRTPTTRRASCSSYSATPAADAELAERSEGDLIEDRRARDAERAQLNRAARTLLQHMRLSFWVRQRESVDGV
jgi:hypothetical protein